MPDFNYKVRDTFGKLLTGTIKEQSKDKAIEHLKKMGYTPVSVEEIIKLEILKGFLSKFMRVKEEEVIIFTRQLYTLQKAGLPLVASLQGLQEQTENRLFKSTLLEVIIGIKTGSSFSESLQKHPKVFDGFYVNMVRAGEASGQLDVILERLSLLGEYTLQTKAKIKSATRYPVIVVLTLIVAFLVIVGFVLPRFADLFARFNVPLPLPTRILLAINYIIIHWWHVCLIGLGVSLYFLRRFVKTEEGRLIWDNLKLKIPVAGPLVLQIIMSRFARVMSILVKSGIPLLSVLDLVEGSVGNMVVARSIQHIKQSVNEGKPMSEPMKISGLFTPIVIQMVTVGENTGKLDDLLFSVSEHYDMQVDYILKNLTSYIEPFLIFILGIMVLVMALAIFLPLWNIISVFRAG